MKRAELQLLEVIRLKQLDKLTPRQIVRDYGRTMCRMISKTDTVIGMKCRDWLRSQGR